MVAAPNDLRSTGILACIFLALCLGGVPQVQAQRVILSDDFESDVPDTFPVSADFYARSVVGDPLTDPAKIVISGGAFADPFGAGNQSVVLHNPTGKAQMAITWTSAFDDNPSAFRNGVIEFDLWMDKPLPPPFEPGFKYWSFLDARLGYGNAERNGVSTNNDVTIWDNFRIQNIIGVPGEPVENIVDAGAQQSLGGLTTYSDPVPGGLMAPDQSFHVRFEIDGTAGDESYVIKVNGTPITWFQDGATSHPWVPSATGINILSFLTDASAGSSGLGGSGNVYLDNLVVTNNDLPPGVDGDYNNNGTVDAADYALWRNGGPLQNDATPGVQPGDYDVWQANFGDALGSGSTAVSTAVPEPSALLLLVLVLAINLGLRQPRLRM